MKLAAISVDLDEVVRYEAIHGLPSETSRDRHPVYDRCVPRFVAWLEGESIPATFFAVGEDLERPRNAETLRELASLGHEIGNHSYRHHYDLVRRSDAEMANEIEAGATAIEGASGFRPVGFRAPGYTVSDRLFRVLEASGVLYDSSVFPCPSYYGVKASALGAMRLGRRKSASILDSPWVLRAPRTPYRLGRPYWTRGEGLMELPIGVTPLGLPYIGTSLVVGGPRVAARLTRGMLGRELINLELHGLDLADAEKDDLRDLARYRVDLRRNSSVRLEALKRAVGTMRDAGYEMVTLATAAMRFRDRPSH